MITLSACTQRIISKLLSGAIEHARIVLEQYKK